MKDIFGNLIEVDKLVLYSENKRSSSGDLLIGIVYKETSKSFKVFQLSTLYLYSNDTKLDYYHRRQIYKCARTTELVLLDTSKIDKDLFDMIVNKLEIYRKYKHLIKI